MKKLKITVLSFLIFTLKIYSQTFEWVKSFGSFSSDYGYAITSDSFGNVYTTGYFRGTVDFDPGAGSTNLTALGYDDVYIQKLDALGNLVWVKSIGSPYYDRGFAIKVDPQGNVYTAGTFQGTVDFDPNTGITNLTSNGGSLNSDIFIQKLDSAGNFVWAKSFGGLNADQVYAIELDIDGNVYTTGSFQDSVDINPGSGSNVLVSNGIGDIFVQKLDSAGNFIWAKSFGSYNWDIGYSINVDRLGNVLTTGSFQRIVDFDPNSGIYNVSAVGGAFVSNAFIHKLDSSGNFVWVKALKGSNGVTARSSTTDALGNIYTTGHFKGIVDFNPGQATANLTAVGDNDVFIQKVDKAGNFKWAKSFGSNDWDIGFSIAVDSIGNVYSTGTFKSTADFDPGPSVANLTANGSKDIYLQKLDSNGNFLWAKSFGGISSDQGISIANDLFGNILVTGTFGGSTDFDSGSSSGVVTANGGSDIFVYKASLTNIVGLPRSKNEILVSAYPNPTNDIVNIQFEKTSLNTKITLFDNVGRVIKSILINSTNQNQINLNGEPGVYYLKIETQTDQSIIKLIKE